MDLDFTQTRRVFLAGKVAFPTPFPSTATLSFEAGHLTLARGQDPRAAKFVVVQECSRSDRSLIRAILQRGVVAMFIPGYKGADGRFRISRKRWVNDFDKGEWFLDSDVTAEAVVKRLNLQKDDDVTSRGSVLRGIVFVSEDQAVVTISETTATAGELTESPGCYCTCCEFCTPCTCCERCTCCWF